jgi:Arylsulfotransferase (ASST)
VVPLSPKRRSNLVELDDRYRVVGRYHPVATSAGANGHDSILLPNGHRVFLVYEPRSSGHVTDAVIQEVNAQGSVVFQWNSSALRRESMRADKADYAHVNSVQVTRDGNFLVSFRHLSAVLKIARHRTGRHARGDVIWRLGGRASDFRFTHDPFRSGPCGQHTAYEQPDGHIVIYDNGSRDAVKLCVDPHHPWGPPVARPVTRVTEYVLHPRMRSARLVWSWDPDRFAFYAGSAQRLRNGNTLVGWSVGRRSIADEVSPSGQVLWRLRVEAGETRPYSTYRARRVSLPDVMRPKIRLVSPRRDAVYSVGAAVRVRYSCTDRGGSNLMSCGGDVAHGAKLDTATTGRHTFTVRADDGAGNTTTVTRTYTVSTR